ncbi:MAG: 3',5'-cyclic-nucleotide phosphodiesterase [Desulfuromonadaceae bacterium]|nr:3',5'-cyclic-nucleotide phosphodiesterase [Desulfuromonadaceae bacterium]MDD5107296.1 3',5'-cyclic-nucleotide phosphodiesterase [Desulfuromonadaceae bacterium]
MRIEILGCSASCFPGQYPTAFLVDEHLLVDAGTIGSVLDAQRQSLIRAILITHPHLDHIKELASLADNLLIMGEENSFTVYGLDPVLESIKQHVFNNTIWPDFSRLPNAYSPVLRWSPLESERSYPICGYTVTPFGVNHSVAAAGYKIAREDASFIFSGDTGPTELIWKAAAGISALIVEVSFPNELEQLAVKSLHLTPAMLARELEKLPEIPPLVLVTHVKSSYYGQIAKELAEITLTQLEIMHEGNVYNL